MKVTDIFQNASNNIIRNRRTFILSSVGLVVGVATLTFFVHLGMGVQQGVLNRIFPVNQIEIEPKTVNIIGLQEDVIDRGRLGEDLATELATLPGVSQVYPKLRSKFQARLWGGENLFGYAARVEAFFDGLVPALLYPELQENERIEAKRQQRALKRQESCKRDEECRLGEVCHLETETCQDIEYWERFADHGIAVPCQGDEACGEGARCIEGICHQGCEGCDGICGLPYEGAQEEVCLTPCQADGDCQLGEICQDGGCQRLRCTLAEVRDQQIEDPIKAKGRLLDRCANGVSPGSPACEPLPCPGRTYCAPSYLTQATGYCEAPIPAVLSPMLIELFNNAAATSLGMRRLDGLDALLGLTFQLHLGDSYFAKGLAKNLQSTKRAEVVGFSQKAMDFGITMPLAYVHALNGRYQGADAANRYDTFILETETNEAVSQLITEIDSYGMSLARRSKDAQKAADLLFILTVVFSFISLVILFVAGINIMHTFLTLVTERRYEIGIMRAVGATRADVRRLFLTEALLLGLFGGIVGNILSYLITRGANWVAAKYLEGIPFRPDEFFAYDGRVIVGAILFACLFCLLGALIPAQRAASLDPARVLSS